MGDVHRYTIEFMADDLQLSRVFEVLHQVPTMGLTVERELVLRTAQRPLTDPHQTVLDLLADNRPHRLKEIVSALQRHHGRGGPWRRLVTVLAEKGHIQRVRHGAYSARAASHALPSIPTDHKPSAISSSVMVVRWPT